VVGRIGRVFARRRCFLVRRVAELDAATDVCRGTGISSEITILRC